MTLIASRTIGAAGVMEIRDVAGVVTMRVRSTDPATHTDALPYRVYVGGWSPGASSWSYANYPSGSPWVTIWTGTISSTQWVEFVIGPTGTQGFGTGTRPLGVTVSRSTAVPSAPTPLSLDQITRTSMRYRFDGADVTGDPSGWEAEYATSPDFSDGVLVVSSGTTVATDLIPGREYFWRSRGVNANGPGVWSAVWSARTLAGMYVGSGGNYVAAEVYVGQGGIYVPAEVLVGVGGNYVHAG